MNGLHVCLGLSTITGYKDPKSQGRETEKLKIIWSPKYSDTSITFPPDILIVITLWNRGTFPPKPLGEQGCREGWDRPAVRWAMWPATFSGTGKRVCDWPPMHVSPHLLLWAVLTNKSFLYNIKLPSNHPHMIIYFTQHWMAEILQQPDLSFWFLVP